MHRRPFRKLLVFNTEHGLSVPKSYAHFRRVNMAFLEARASAIEVVMVREFTWSVGGRRRPLPPWDKLKLRG
jgi:hypothetical protein